ncbi:hypothetical protein MA04_02843 [Alcanivorax balearicus MACL04]|uniref:Transcriptional regulator AbiEi antitoxin N-terminal domain-containing protein n=1 Tax=Alloalcanivorax balearicus MACL04 TaxID=1177182 RepID=A0ABT2R175_9GAMM|nr:type IV toxin-antitoxin system AbiEi family antitoxin [Alloalcanivorax balearicus]MCU5783543.1 hypothetical protein [Alloalcanivorax balearicus MACL04]
MSLSSPSEWAASLPMGQVATRQWLQARGASRHALDNALKSGRLIAPARGLLARPGLSVTWEGVVASLDRMMPDPVYVGGLSALERSGLGHYVTMASRVHLYSPGPAPAWLARLPVGVDWVWHVTTRLWDQQALQDSGSVREQRTPTLEGWPMASPEQAFLEVLADVPESVSFEHADNLMRGLSALSPRRLDTLLHACRHVRVKRLFFFFADRHPYPWRKRLDPADYDLGSGKRSVVRGGRLDRTYLITVPEAFHGQE